MNFGRYASVAAAVVLLLGIAAFFLFRFTYSSDRMTAVQKALGITTAPPERHVVPDGFHGWAVVHYGVDGTTPLDESDGVLVVSYPAGGRLETSTPARTADGFHHRQYFERHGDHLVPLTRLGQIWGEYTMRTAGDETDAVMQVSSGFFVGTFEEFRASKRPGSHDIVSISKIADQDR
jgi:hypothetical protein